MHGTILIPKIYKITKYSVVIIVILHRLLENTPNQDNFVEGGEKKLSDDQIPIIHRRGIRKAILLNWDL